MRVSTIHVRALVEAVEATGRSASPLLARVGLAPTTIAEPYGFIEEAQLDALAEAAIEELGDPAFGLRWGESSPMMRYDLMAMMAGAYAPTLRASLECLLRFQPMLAERPELELVESGETATLRFTPVGGSDVGRRVRSEVAMAGFVRFLRYAAPGGDVIRRVDFEYPKPEHAAEYLRFFGDRASFARPFTGLVLSREALDRALPQCNPELHDALVAQAEQVLARIVRGLTYGDRLRRQMSATFPDLPSITLAARSFGVSERSLRRRLAEEGSSYSRIVQEARCLVAQRLLLDATRSVQEVAFASGFESSTAFHRAFKRWTGKSPQEFRTSA